MPYFSNERHPEQYFSHIQTRIYYCNITTTPILQKLSNFQPLPMNQENSPSQSKAQRSQNRVDLTQEENQGLSINQCALTQQVMKMPKLALLSSKFFLSMSKFCLTFHHNHVEHTSRSTLETRINNKNKDQGSMEEQNKRQEEIIRQEKQPTIKRPRTAYILFFKSMVPSYRQKYPNHSISQLTKLIAIQWKNTSEQLKEPWLARSMSERKTYEESKKQFKLKQFLDNFKNQVKKDKLKQKKTKKVKGSESGDIEEESVEDSEGI